MAKKTSTRKEEKRQRLEARAAALIQELRRKDQTNNLADFFKAAWKVLEPTTPLVWSWHYEYLCEWLQFVQSGEFKVRYPDHAGIIINIPPRSAKSTLASITFPVWTWVQDASRRFFSASNAMGLSTNINVKRRDLINSDWFRANWGDLFQLKEDQDTKAEFDNSKTGKMLATSVGSKLIGKGGDIGLIDDPIDPMDAESETERNNANIWFEDTFRTRLNDPGKNVMIVIMQRLHEDDLTGHILSNEKSRWIHIKVPLECEEDEDYTFPISGRVHHRLQGDVLQPDRNTPGVVANLKIASRKYAGQYQQRPSPKGGVIFNPNHFRRFKIAEAPSFDQTVISADCTFKDTSSSDMVSIEVWGRIGPRKYLLDKRTDHLGYAATKQAILAMRTKHPRASAVLIEDKANGSAIIEELRLTIAGIIPITPKESKEARAWAVQPEVESGNIYVPEDESWGEDFIATCAKFPNVKYDDDVDSFTQAINWMRSGVANFMEFMNRDLLKTSEKKTQQQENMELMGQKPKPEVKQKQNNPVAGRCPQCDNPNLSQAGLHWRCAPCNLEGDLKPNY